MIKKRVLGGSVIFVSTLMLAGCGKVTPDSLLKDMQNATKKSNHQQMELNLGFESTSSQGDMNLNSSILIDYYNYTKDIKMEGTIGMKFAVVSMELPLTLYQTTEGDAYMQYIKVDTSSMGIESSWTKNPLGDKKKFEKSEDIMEKIYSKTQVKESLKVEENKEEKGIYLLSGNVTTDDIEEVFDVLLDGNEEAASLQAGMEEYLDTLGDDFKMPFTIRVDKKTSLPKNIIVDMNSLLSASDLEEDVKIKKFNFEFNFKKFDKDKSPGVPKDVKDSAKTFEEAMDESPLEGFMNPSSDDAISEVPTGEIVQTADFTPDNIADISIHDTDIFQDVMVKLKPSKVITDAAQVDAIVKDYKAKEAYAEELIGDVDEGQKWVVVEYELLLNEDLQIPSGGKQLTDPDMQVVDDQGMSLLAGEERV